MYIALGSNLGDRQGHLERALELLDEVEGIEVVRCSSLLENPALGGPENQPDFLNAVAEVSTSLSPSQLWTVLARVEEGRGRTREVAWGPRTLDLDILAYGTDVIDAEELTIPHPRLANRDFVLGPWRELAPHFVVPSLGKSVEELWQSLTGCT